MEGIVKIWFYLLIILIFLIGCSEKSNVVSEKQDYIVVLNKAHVKTEALSKGQFVATQSLVRQMMTEVASPLNLKVEKLFHVTLQGGVYQMTDSEKQQLEKDPRVAYVEKDEYVSINAAQVQATWGLDRIDQPDLPLNGTYEYNANESSDVNVYVIDTGIQITHNDFNGRAVHGYDTVDSDNDATDCNGHGTHVAGTIASSTYGVAKNVKIHGVRVLGCRGGGAYSDVIEGIEWVTSNHKKPAVTNMSLGGPTSRAIDEAVKASIQAGVTYVIAAGNSNTDACNASPARVPQAITVGSTDRYDTRSSFSNYGVCVDIFAPGSDITSTWIGSNQSTKTISGTSMAAPHVAGVVARYLSSHPEATPEQVRNELVQGALSDKIQRVGSQSPNLLLNTQFLENQKDTPDPKLENGITLTNLSGRQSEQQHFDITVPQGASDLKIEIAGGSGDADLYVKLNSPATESDYDCRPYKNGNEESCSWESPSAGTYHVMLNAYASYSAMSLTATYKRDGQYTGVLNTQGDTKEHQYSAQAGRQKLNLVGPEAADFDLYLYKKDQAGGWELLESSKGYSSEENIELQAVEGSYMAVVRSFSGQGEYSLTIDK